MILTEKGIQDTTAWEKAGYDMPHFNRSEMIEKTKKNPTWIHFGAGNIFRAFQANLMQRLLNQGEAETGLIAADGFDYEIVEKSYRPHDNLSVLVTLKADGTIDKTVIGSIAESCIMDSNREDEFNRLREIFANPSLQMVSFSITEKGYDLKGADGNYRKDVSDDFAKSPEDKPQSYLGKLTALIYTRFKKSGAPLALVSMDNCSHNGEKLYNAVMPYVNAWCDNKLVEEDFRTYVKSKVSFPWSMIDKITPRPDKTVEAMLAKDDLDLTPAETSRHTFIAPFVNSEESEYLVIEDDFPNGRPALEKAGVIFTTRDTVNQVERMKVTTCLNPLHTALAVYGCLLGYTRISEEMKDEDLLKLVKTLGYTEGLPVVTDPKIINPKEFIDTVVEKRIPNPFMPDTPQRIATDTSRKLAIRYGETIKSYMANKDTDKLNMIPLVEAGWLRYLLAVDDNGSKFELSPDPLAADLTAKLSGLKTDGTTTREEAEKVLADLLHNTAIFGVDLYEAGLADKVLNDFVKLCNGKGAIRKTIHEAVNK